MQKSGAANWARRGGLIALTMTTMIAAGCGGGGGGGSPAPAAAPGSGVTPPPRSNKAPTIAASPTAEVQVGATYKLLPQAQDEDGDTLAFSIQNKPNWAAFNTTTGELSGTPGAAHVGAYSDVVISVSDGASSASLPAFAITVALVGTPTPDGAGVALSWDVPTTTVDGETLGDLTGYRIHYGTSKDALTGAIEIPSSGANQYVVRGLEKGTYYFAVRAVTATGAQSEPSNVISRVIG